MRPERSHERDALQASRVAALPRGPRGHVLLGSGPDFGRDQLGFYAACAREYGDLVPVRLGPAARPSRLSPGRHRGDPGHPEPRLRQESRGPAPSPTADRQRPLSFRGRVLAATAPAHAAGLPPPARRRVRGGDDLLHRATSRRLEGRRRPRRPRRDDDLDPGDRRQDAVRCRRLGRELRHRARRRTSSPATSARDCRVLSSSFPTGCRLPPISGRAGRSAASTRWSTG